MTLLKRLQKNKGNTTFTDEETKEIISALIVKSDLTTYLKTEANHKMGWDTFLDLKNILSGDYYRAYI